MSRIERDRRALYIPDIEQHPPVLVVGAGGHALAVIGVLGDLGRQVVGCLSVDGRAGAWLPVEVIGRSADAARLARNERAAAIVAVGDNYARQRVHAELVAAGVALVTAVSPHAIVAGSARLGRGAVVMAGAIVNEQAEIGEGVIVNTAAVVDRECRVGEFAHVAQRGTLADRVIVGRGAFIGVGASVVPMVSIGDWAVVGAGAAVTGTVAAGTTVTGVPAKIWSE